jgi:hypothetical protein
MSYVWLPIVLHFYRLQTATQQNIFLTSLSSKSYENIFWTNGLQFYSIYYRTSFHRGHAVASRHCATSRKVAGSFPDCFINIFYCCHPSGHSVTLGVDSASNRNDYQGYFLGGKGGRCVGLTPLPPSCADCLEFLGASTSWSSKGLFWS